jgi:hypothetical protein
MICQCESSAVTHSLDDVEAIQRARPNVHAPGVIGTVHPTNHAMPVPRGLSASYRPSEDIATATSCYGSSHASCARWSLSTT